MANLNFKHLRYFWMVAKAGSVARAGEQLHLTPQSISGQLGALEDSLGVELFRKAGRGLELTEMGRRIFSYADEIFAIGNELLEVAQDRAAAKTLPLRIGIADSVPKSVAYRVVEPALRVGEALRLVCREGRLAALLGDLAVHRLDMVIADRPMPANINVRAYNHALGSSDVTVFGAPALLRTLTGSFPRIIDQAPFLLPGEDVAVRPRLTQWFESQGLYPRIVGEFDDSALLKSFGQAGSGLFVAPTAIADYVRRQYAVEPVGRIEPVIEELYAITTERRLTHPGVIAVVKATQREVFGSAARAKRAARPESGSAAAEKRAGTAGRSRSRAA